MTCSVCSHTVDGPPSPGHGLGVHPECLSTGLLQDAALAAVELIAAVVAPTVIVWAG